MNMLHESALLGNMTLEQFTESAKPTLSVAAQLGVSLKDTLASFSLLTQAGYDSAEAATQLRAMLTKIIHPSKQAREEIASLAAYLCSARADFATGGCYIIDGGQTRIIA